MVVPNPLGDGFSASSALEGFWPVEHFGSAHDRWDILYVDDRGTGRSQPVVCPALQDFNGSRQELATAVRECGVSLGPMASRLGAAYIADDLNDVRAALHLGRIDLYGAWAAAITLDAYAVRFPKTLRSLTYEAPTVPNYRTDPWLRKAPGRLVASAVATCRSDPMCAEADQDVAGAIGRLAKDLAKQPVTTIGYADDGTPQPVTLDEEGLIRNLQDLTGFINQGEAGAAALAWLKRRDPAPLARMAAVSDATYPRNPVLQAPAEVVDFAATFARQCSDYALPFNRFSHSPAQRQRQYQRAVRQLPHGTFAPFSATAWLEENGSAQYCVGWPAPTRWRAPVPAGSHFPDVPMLSVVSNAGTFTGPELSRPFVRQYPRGRLIVQLMGDAGPINQCGDLMEQWLVGLSADELRCPDGGAWDSTGVFPLRADQQRPSATPIQGADDHSTQLDRKVAAMAVSVARDYLLHSQRPGTDHGTGLRGGTWNFTASGDTVFDVAYHDCRWSKDVSFSGSSHFEITGDDGNSPTSQLFQWTADFTVTGPQGRVGTLHVAAAHHFEHDARATITGTVNGRHVAVTAPAL